MLMPKRLENQKENQARKRKGTFLDVLFSPSLSFPAGCAKRRGGGGKSKEGEEKSPTFVKAGTFDSSSNIL